MGVLWGAARRPENTFFRVVWFPGIQVSRALDRSFHENADMRSYLSILGDSTCIRRSAFSHFPPPCSRRHDNMAHFARAQHFRSILKWTFAAFACLLIAACSVTMEARSDAACTPTNNVIRDGSECGGGVRGTVSQAVSPTSLSVYDLKIDLSDSTVLVESTDGWASITVKKVDGSIAATTAQWSRVGSELVLSDPIAVQAWLAGMQQNIEEFTLDINDIEVAGSEGTNVFSMEFMYQDEVIDGASTSWYSSGSSCEGMFPDPQLCF